MNIKFASAALMAATVSTGIFAQSPTVPQHNFREGRIDLQPEQQNNHPVQVVKSDLSRQDVSSAYIASRKEVAAMNGEDSGSIHLSKQRDGNLTALVQYR